MKWGLPADQYLENNPERPHVTLLVLLPAEDFRGHLLGCTCLGGQDFPGALIDLGQPEINELHFPVFLVDGHEVLGFEVSVDNVALVALVDCPDHLVEHIPAVVLTQLAHTADPFEQLSPVEQLHDEEETL